jgi:hypothetical protein
MKKITIIFCILTVFLSCKKKSTAQAGPPGLFNTFSVTINNKTGALQYGVNFTPVITATFSDAVDRNTVAANVLLQQNGTTVPVNYSYQNNDSTIIFQPATALKALTSYMVTINTNLRSIKNIQLTSNSRITFVTQIDSTDKFPCD